jgi:hypothetical protein
MDARAAALSIVEAPAVAAPPTAAAGSDGRAAPPAERVYGQLRGLSLPPAARAAIRDPRVLTGGAIVVVVLLVAGLLGRGLTSSAAAPTATASPAPAVATPPPAAVTITLSGGVTGAYSLAGSAGLGRPADAHLASTWTDALGDSLTMTGRASAGTQPTGPDLVLALTLVVADTPVTFTSDGGECVVGMALKPATVSGSIVCKKLRSDDGTLVVSVTGSYRT